MAKTLKVDKTQTPLTSDEWKLLRKMVGLKNAKRLLVTEPEEEIMTRGGFMPLSKTAVR